MSASLRLSKLATNLNANSDLTSVGGLSYPSSDGANGQVLTTDGAGNLSFTTVSSDVVDDTTPQLGGDLDPNGFNIDAGSAAPNQNGADLAISAEDPGFTTQFNYISGGDLILNAGDASSGGISANSERQGGDITLNAGITKFADGSLNISESTRGVRLNARSLVLSPRVNGEVGYFQIHSKGTTGSLTSYTIKPPANTGTGASYTWTLPNSSGSNNQVLTTDGAGTLSWTTPSGGGGSFADRYVAAILFG